MLQRLRVILAQTIHDIDVDAIYMLRIEDM